MKVSDNVKNILGVICIIAVLLTIGLTGTGASVVKPYEGWNPGPKMDCCLDPDASFRPPGNFVRDTPENVPGHTTPKPEAALNVDPNMQSEIRDPATGSGSRPGGAGGSCPYLYVWDGNGYVFDNDIMPFRGRSAENTNYYRIQQALIPEDGYYKVRIAEELPETSYLDSVRLFTIDHPAAVDVYPDLKGNIFNISNPQPLLSCTDGQGNDQLSRLRVREEAHTPDTYFEGKRGDYIIADFGNLSGNKIIKLVITSNGPAVDDSRPLPLKYTSGKNIYIESLVNRGSVTDWQTHFVFSPHELWATNVFDITTILPDANGDYKLRFFFTNTHKVDFIGIDTSPEVDKEVHELAPVYARAGEDVLSRVSGVDGNYLVMKKGGELFLKFPYQPASNRSGFKRDFVFVSRGYYVPDPK